MDKDTDGIEDREYMSCGARTLSCFQYEDPATLERVGLKLLAQACICPAAVLAANVSLMEGEGAGSRPHNIPFSDGLVIGPKGAMVYSSTCRSQIVCGPFCMGLPVLCMENLLHRQRIRDKYGLQRPSSFLEVGAGFCYPCSLYETHTFLRDIKYQQMIMQQRSGNDDAQGPLETAMRAMKRTARSKGTIAGQDSNSVAVPQSPSAAVIEPNAVTANSGVAKEGDAAPAALQPMSPSFSAQGPENAEMPTDSVGETPNRVVTLYGREQVSNRRAQACMPTASASSAESRSTPASSIPPPEVTDSPRMRRGAQTTSSSASRQDDAESALADSASFPVPSALPLPAMVRDPPTFAVPPALKPPDSTDPEVMEAWMQGPKLTHLSQSLQSRGEGSQIQQDSRPRPAAPTRSGSEASLFSIALEPTDKHLSPAKQPNGPQAHTARIAGTSAVATHAATEGPGSSRELQGTITSSTLSVMIDQAMLNGSAGSTTRGSGGAGSVPPDSSDPAAFWTGYRQTAMTPIAEAEAEDAVSMQSNPAERSSRRQDGSTAALGDTQCDNDSACSSQRPEPIVSRNAQRGLRSSGAPSVRTSGSAGSSGSVPATVTGVNAVALTALARMGSDSGGVVSACNGRGSGPRIGNNKQNTFPGLQRRAAAPMLTVGRAAGASLRAQAAAKGLEQPSASGGTEDDMGASADNFTQGGAAFQENVASSPAPPLSQCTPPSAVSGHSPCTYGDGDDEVNLASIRPSFIDAPELQHFKQVLRVAGEEVDTQPAPATLARPPPVAGPNTTTALANAGSARLVTLAPAVGSLSQRVGGGRYGSRPAIPPPAAFQAYAPVVAAQEASYCADGPSQDDTDGVLSEEASSAIDGPVSSADVSPASGGQRAHPATRGVTPRERFPASAGGDATVSVAVTPAGAPPPCTAGEPEVTPNAACTSASKHSASGLSVAESNVAYDSTADSVAISQHRQKHWINWMAQSGVSVGTSVGLSVRPGYGKTARGSKAPVDQSTSYANAGNRAQLSSMVVEEEDGSGEAPVYERWG
ncbi:hypothetical protein Agub_g6246 [Astrephomene gubernaculifera]|uniref:Uncharacterized protein n=1 Tax=Astrephomene gubernaculifera TaxID=47775 RepID=A0AAD3HLE5_9CHLO|nr:hypothetical protein Agub_g6246 [Astrephomene gubernaculifera]